MWSVGQTGLKQQVRERLAAEVYFTEGPDGPRGYLEAISKGLAATNRFNTQQSPHMDLLTSGLGHPTWKFLEVLCSSK